jgi:methylglutaconyl-CoA hydratase
MLASRVSSEEALRIGFVNEIVDTCEDFQSSLEKIITEVMSTGPMAISEAKKLTLIFDRWKDDDSKLRQFTLDKTSEMRGSKEGQEGLSSFLERRKPNWLSEE